MIPKIIHYCWFGGADIGDTEKGCIASWSHFLPGYEIKRWDESNFDLACCAYVAEAYRAKKWAFVSDYARFSILYEYGGLYFDTDVELIRSIGDLIAAGSFMGLESDANVTKDGRIASSLAANPGLGLAANPGLTLYRTILDSYAHDHFIKPDGSYNYYTVVERTTEILREAGLADESGTQQVADVTIYPSAYFNPIDLATGRLNIKKETRSIHHYGASWQPESLRRVGKIKQSLTARLPWLPVGIRSSMAWFAYIMRTGDTRALRERY